MHISKDCYSLLKVVILIFFLAHIFFLYLELWVNGIVKLCEFRLNEGEAVILQIFATTHLLFLGLEKWHNLVIMFFNILGYGYW